MKREIIRIDSNHAKILARAIYSDISAYIQSHQEEYKEFLLREEENTNEKTEINCRPQGV